MIMLRAFPLFPLFLLLLSASVFAESADVTLFKHANIEGPRLWVDIYKTYTFETRMVADLHVQLTPGRVRIDPGVTQVFDVNVDNFRLTLPPGDLLLKLTASAGMTIEKIEAPLWTCTIAGGSAECRAPALDENCQCGGDILITTRANNDPHGGEGSLEVIATSDLPEDYDVNNSSAATVQTYRHFVVNTNADAGEGSLRAAIEQANQNCSPAPCKILFDMPVDALNTITPATPLPAIMADRVFIDGGSKITLDGTAAHYGLDLRAPCESVVQGLALRNFGDQGLAVATDPCPDSINDPLDQRRVSGNTIAGNFRGLRLDQAQGVLVRDNVISDNLRSGVWSWNGKALRILDNRIERNGASGIFLGPEVHTADVLSNTIAGHPDMGVAVALGAEVIQIRRNAMSNNRGLGIDWGLDGISPVAADDSAAQSNAPVILSARYDPATDQTQVTMTLESAPLGSYPLWDIDVYANDAPDGDGGQWIGSHEIYEQPSSAVVMLLRGNHSGKWLNATSTRVRSIYLELYIGPSITSELSNSVRVE